MGFFNVLLGNAAEIDLNEIKEEFKDILVENEELESAFKVVRDKWIFTNKRLIMLNVQGVTGNKREYHSIPYKSITQFAVETAGAIDDDSEMRIWVKGLPEPYEQEFTRGTNVKAVQKALALHIL